MSASENEKPSKFSPDFPADFLKENAGVFLYYAAMIAMFELFMTQQLKPLLSAVMRVVYLYAAHLNIKSRAPKYLNAHGNFSGDQAVLRGCGSALLAAAGLSLFFVIEDYFL